MRGANVGPHAGRSWSSSSRNATHSPSASSRPRLRATVMPEFSWRTVVTRGSSIDASTSAVPSVLPSSTTTTPTSSGAVWSSTLRTAAATTSARL